MYKLDIDLSEVASYLGFAKQPLDTLTLQDVEKATALLQKEATYKTEYKVFDISCEQDVHVLGTNLHLEGNSIKTLLQESHQCILLAVTLGQSTDLLIRKTQATNLNLGVILDVCASSMVEHLCNQLEDDLKIKWQEKGEFFTDRFSPGYGDLPLAIQGPFCNILDTSKKMGLHVSSENIMIPRKSITAIIGISKKAQPMRIKGCNFCDFFEHCQIRKGGNVCG